MNSPSPNLQHFLSSSEEALLGTMPWQHVRNPGVTGKISMNILFLPTNNYTGCQSESIFMTKLTRIGENLKTKGHFLEEKHTHTHTSVVPG